MKLIYDNPVGTDGFAFLEFSAATPEPLISVFKKLGLVEVARHATHQVSLWQQNEVYFLLNTEPHSSAAQFANQHGPCVSGMAFRVRDAVFAQTHCLNLQAKPFISNPHDWYHDTVPAISGIGDNVLLFVDSDTFFTQQFEFIPGAADKARQNPGGLHYIDHVTHNVYQGNMDKWADFYTKLFNFREIRYFDIKGKRTGLHSRAMTGPCNKLRIPINESSDDHSQIAEYLREYNGEGIQHIALFTQDIYSSVEALRQNGMTFLDTPDTYYELIDARVPNHGEPLERMKSNRILIDGSQSAGNLLQIFTETVIGPVFFEIIQRKGNQGFGEGNFQALFDSIELDQIKRGVLKG